jgi:hypothetical protein
VVQSSGQDEVQFPPLLLESEAPITCITQSELHYLTQAAQECKNAGADLMFLFTPVASDQALTVIAEMKQMISESSALSNVQIVDMNEFIDEMELSREDFYDGEHLYLWGMKKATAWLESEIIAEKIQELPTYTPDAKQWWDTQAAHWDKVTTPTSPQDNDLEY